MRGLTRMGLHLHWMLLCALDWHWASGTGCNGTWLLDKLSLWTVHTPSRKGAWAGQPLHEFSTYMRMRATAQVPSACSGSMRLPGAAAACPRVDY
jgi:hypothetical protein